jgi:diguanylate cyclase (GGDEF)-like protein/PAS domain S-box-containing protein
MSDPASRVASAFLSLTFDGVLVLDGRNRVQMANPCFYQWTSFEPDAVLGRDVAEFWDDPRRWADWRAGFRLQGGEIPHERLELKTKGGDPLPVEARMAILPRTWRRPAGTVLTLHDLRQEKFLERLVKEDPLCGVASRSALLSRFDVELSRSRRFGTALGVVLMDVDGFRALNELWGPDFGDQVLRVVGAELRDLLRPGDAAGRLGSDEFLVLLPQASPFQTEETAHRLRTSLSQRLFAPQGFEVGVTASFGVAAVRVQEPVSVSSVLARVAEALDRARARGRNRVEFSP